MVTETQHGIISLVEAQRARVPQYEVLDGMQRIIEGHTVAELLTDTEEAAWKADMLGAIGFLVDYTHNTEMANSPDDEEYNDAVFLAEMYLEYLLGPEARVTTPLIQSASRLGFLEAAAEVEPMPMIQRVPRESTTSAKRLERKIQRGLIDQANEEIDGNIAYEKNIQLGFLDWLMDRYEVLPPFTTIEKEREQYRKMLRRKGIEAEGLI